MPVLADLLDELPGDLARQVFTHSSWTAHRADSYERLAFLGDSVLALAVTTHLYPTLEAERFGAGRLTKIRAQAVSRRSCARVAKTLGIPERLTAAAPPGASPSLARTQSVQAEVVEALIGACYLAFGFDRTAAAVIEDFLSEIATAMEGGLDFKSELQERLAQRGEIVIYEVVSEEAPPHERSFLMSAIVGGREAGRGSGSSKKEAEQAAAAAALERMDR